uniref:hypothetical protein n=1 Tax=Salmonella enterica TaxID=28901 RepID=UPI0027E4D569|nr:hypothetical protein [Salmonella enterica]
MTDSRFIFVRQVQRKQERQKAAREAERGREAWTLGQGMKKPVAGCYGRLTRWKGGGDVVYMALL